MTIASHESIELRGAEASRELLARRVATLPEVLRATLASDEAAIASSCLGSNARFIVTGIGGSEGPARIVASSLRTQTARDARYVAMSSLVCETYEADPARDVLVLVSHGLCPNARAVLSRRDRFASTVLFTGRRRDEIEGHLVGDDVTVQTLPPRDESGLLVRVLAPPASTLGALRWVASLTRQLGLPVGPLARLGEVPDAVAHTLAARTEPHVVGDARVGIVSCGDDGDAFAHGLRWKWLEAIGRGDPPCWDALAFAHGPFQDLWEERAVIWALLYEGVRGDRELTERLASMMHAGRHRVLRVIARLPRPLGWFEHDAWFDRVVLTELEDRPRDLAQWPGKGRDDALYGMT